MADWRGGKARASMSKQKTLNYVRARLALNADHIEMWKITRQYFSEWAFPGSFQHEWREMCRELMSGNPIGLLHLSILLEELQQEMDQERKKRKTT